jgi:hypothetical protein
MIRILGIFLATFVLGLMWDAYTVPHGADSLAKSKAQTLASMDDAAHAGAKHYPVAVWRGGMP